MNLTDSISNLKGIGPQRQKVLSTHGLNSLEDLLYYFPRKHLDRTILTPINEFYKDRNVTLVANVETFGVKRIRRGSMFQVIVSDGSGLLTLNWFNGVRYVKDLFKVGDKLAINGKVEWYNGFAMTHPEFEKLQEDEDPLQTGKIIPIYPLTQELKAVGIDQRIFRKMIKETFDSDLVIPEVMPKYILENNDLVNLDKALRLIHFSDGLSELESAIRRLKFDEHFFLQLLLALRKKNIQSCGAKRLIDVGPYFRPVSENLDYELTNAQKNVIQEVHLDMKKAYPMNRLIQGDVGCGKTIVAILVSTLAVGNHVQVAVMAPTEILARQHFILAKKF